MKQHITETGSSGSASRVTRFCLVLCLLTTVAPLLANPCNPNDEDYDINLCSGPPTLPVPIAGAVTATVAANSSNNPISLNLSGGSTSSVSVASQPVHGTATASGTSIVYTPTAGYSGSDSFTYRASNASGNSSPATVTVTVSAPTLSFSPAAGSLTGATLDSPYRQTVSASGGSGPYTYAVVSGSLPAGLSLDTGTGVISGTPIASGTQNFTISATDVNHFSNSVAYSLNVSLPAPVAGAVNTTVAANSSNNTIALNLSGGSASSVSVVGQPGHGSASASGTSIVYTPSVGYAGSDSFTYRASNASGSSATATVTVTVSAPTLSFSPAAGSLTGATVDSPYRQSISASGGSGPYTYAVVSGSLPAGLSLDTGSGVISGTPIASGTLNFTISATDVNHFSNSVAYSLNVSLPAPTAGAVSTTVAANSSNNSIALVLGGGAASSVAVVSQPGHGTATVSGTSIVYTPAAGYSGSDSFSYRASNASGSSATATVTVTVSAPVLGFSPAAGSLAGATVGSSYSQTVSASGGTAPYSYALASGSLPAGLSLNSSTGVISGTPTVSGTANFTISATDANRVTNTVAYSLNVSLLAPTAGAVSTTVAANSSNNSIALVLGGGAAGSVSVVSQPGHGTATVSGTSIVYTPAAGYSGSDSFSYSAGNASGSSAAATVTVTVSAPTLGFSPAAGNLPSATAGSNYSQTVSASGGTAPYRYAVVSGSLPAGLGLNSSTGVISGTPTGNGTANFTLRATDSLGATTAADYRLVVAVQPVSVVSSSQVVKVGSSAVTDLTEGASGGPFNRAQVVSLLPVNAGRVELEEVSASPLQAQARVAVGTVMSAAPERRYRVHFTPAPAFVGTAVLVFQLGSVSGEVAEGKVAFIVQPRPDPSRDAEVTGLANAQSRAAERFAQGQIDNLGRRLEQLHQAQQCPVVSQGVQASLHGRALPLDTGVSGPSAGCDAGRWGFWSQGQVNFGSPDTAGGHGFDFTTSGVSLGADYRLSPLWAAGVSVGYGKDRSRIGSNGTRSDADALSMALYGSYHPQEGVFLDGLAGYGRLWFDSQRYVTADPSVGMAGGKRTGHQWFSALTGSYEYRNHGLLLSPYGRLSLSRSDLDSFTEHSGGVHALSYGEQTQLTKLSTLGVRARYDLYRSWGVLSPKMRLEWLHNFSGSSSLALGYADIGTRPYSLTTDAQLRNAANLELGTDLSVGKWWQLGIGYSLPLGSSRELGHALRLDVHSAF